MRLFYTILTYLALSVFASALLERRWIRRAGGQVGGGHPHRECTNPNKDYCPGNPDEMIVILDYTGSRGSMAGDGSAHAIVDMRRYSFKLYGQDKEDPLAQFKEPSNTQENFDGPFERLVHTKPIKFEIQDVGTWTMQPVVQFRSGLLVVHSCLDFRHDLGYEPPFIWAYTTNLSRIFSDDTVLNTATSPGYKCQKFAGTPKLYNDNVNNFGKRALIIPDIKPPKDLGAATNCKDVGVGTDCALMNYFLPFAGTVKDIGKVAFGLPKPSLQVYRGDQKIRMCFQAVASIQATDTLKLVETLTRPDGSFEIVRTLTTVQPHKCVWFDNEYSRLGYGFFNTLWDEFRFFSLAPGNMAFTYQLQLNDKKLYSLGRLTECKDCDFFSTED